jgi:hypothetical protein
MAQQTDVEWPTCDQAGCIGIRLTSGRMCLAHGSEEETAAALQVISETGAIDARGVPITPALLERVLTAAPHDADGRSLIESGQFDGAKFEGDARFNKAIFRGDAGFSGAIFSAHAQFDTATFNWAQFDRATFKADAGFHGATFNWSAAFHGATFNGDAQFDGATFNRDAGFYWATFNGDAQFDGAMFKADARFDQATFEGGAKFGDATFNGSAKFGGTIFNRGGTTTFNGSAHFGGATFNGSAEFAGAAFTHAAWFGQATFNRTAWFGEATFKADAGFAEATFKDRAHLLKATFNGNADFDGAMFKADARFDQATFEGYAGFAEAVFKDEAWFHMATFNHAAAFGGATFEGDARFDRATFEDDAHFGGATFNGSAKFAAAAFNHAAWFGQARFKDHAEFDGATFESDTRFDAAVFNDDAGFGGATFKGYAGFNWAMFKGHARFSEATFKGETPVLGPVVVGGLLDLDEAQFASPVRIEADARALTCRRVRFPGGVQLGVCRALVRLDDTDLSVPSLLTGLCLQPAFVAGLAPGSFDMVDLAPLGSKLHKLDKFLLQAGTVSGPAGTTEQPKLLSLQRANVAGLVLGNVDLADCRFAGAHNLDKLRLEAGTVFGLSPAVAGWERRQVIAEESAWRAARARPGRWKAPFGPEDQPEVLSPGAVAGLYRALRKGREDAKDEPGAADFYYGEMEMRRRARPLSSGNPDGQRSSASRGRVERAILTAYWLVSGYGMRASRAVAWLAAVTAILAAAFYLVGFAVPPRPDSYWTSLLYSFRATLSLTDNQVTLTAWGQLLQAVLRLTGPVLLGLALLALRGRVKR